MSAGVRVSPTPSRRFGDPGAAEQESQRSKDRESNREAPLEGQIRRKISANANPAGDGVSCDNPAPMLTDEKPTGIGWCYRLISMSYLSKSMVVHGLQISAWYSGMSTTIIPIPHPVINRAARNMAMLMDPV